MPRFIMKLERGADAWYLEYSTICDAPVTYGMSLDEFREWYREQEGKRGMDALDARLARVEKHGTSLMDPESAHDAILCNRAGPKETHITYDQIVQRYCIDRAG